MPVLLTPCSATGVRSTIRAPFRGRFRVGDRQRRRLFEGRASSRKRRCLD